jgi:hypothetical protein
MYTKICIQVLLFPFLLFPMIKRLIFVNGPLCFVQRSRYFFLFVVCSCFDFCLGVFFFCWFVALQFLVCTVFDKLLLRSKQPFTLLIYCHAQHPFNRSDYDNVIGL